MEKIMTKKLFNIRFFISFGMILTLCGCSKSFSPRFNSSEQGKITISALKTDSTGLSELIQDFNTVYPNVKIDLIPETDVSSENVDIFFGKPSALLDKKILENTENLSRTSIKTSSINKNLLKTCKINGKNVILPLGLEIKDVYLVNKTILNQNGIENVITGEDFSAAQKTFCAKGIVPVVFGKNAAGNYFYSTFLSELSSSADKKQFLNYYESHNESAALYVEKYFTALNALKNSNTLSVTDRILLDAPFTYVSPDDFRAVFAALNTNSADFEYKILSESKNTTKTSINMCAGMMLNKNAPSKKLAEEFLRFVSTSASLNKYAEINCVPTSAKKNADSRFEKFFESRLISAAVVIPEIEFKACAERFSENLSLYANETYTKAESLQKFCRGE